MSHRISDAAIGDLVSDNTARTGDAYATAWEVVSLAREVAEHRAKDVAMRDASIDAKIAEQIAAWLDRGAGLPDIRDGYYDGMADMKRLAGMIRAGEWRKK